MPMMQIRIVRMRVHQRRMNMRMRVRLAAVPRKIVRMLMVFVVRVAMIVFERFVRVLMRVPLADMQPHADRHQYARDPEREAWRFVQQQQRQ